MLGELYLSEAKFKTQGQALRLNPVIPALWEAKAGESPEVKKFETSPADMAKPHLY